jgi:hypothetical protein
MTALLALDTHPFVPGPGAEWAEPLWTAIGGDASIAHALTIDEIDQKIDDLVAVVAGMSRRSGSVLVLYPVARQARVEALLRTLRRVGPAPIAVAATRMPPLSAAVLALLLRRLGGRPGWDAGRLAAAVPLLEQHLTTVGWVQRVARPVRVRAVPEASRGIGLKWLSVNGFEIRVDTTGLQITRHQGVPVPVPEGSLAFTVGRRGDDERLAPVAPVPTSAGSPGEPARHWFATARSAEMVVLTPALATLAADVERDLAARVQVRACEWCRLETPTGVDGCAFCAHHPDNVAGQPVLVGRR